MSEERIGSYVLEERFAVGGMAEIFRARRRGPGGFDKRVALKRLLPDLNRDPEFVAMFLEEARLASQVSAPNLVQVFDFGEAQGAHFLAMEYVDGADLGAIVAAGGALEIDLALFAAIELCRGLEALHAAAGLDGAPLGIVHRDVTPGNVLVSTKGEVKLGDFGIAKAKARALRTEKGAIKGKLAYLSPEQARGDEVDARSDVYGVGLILFELLTGLRFLQDAPEAQMIVAAQRPEWRPPSTLRSAVSPALDDLVKRALAADPTQRFPDAATLRAALERVGVSTDPAHRLGERVLKMRGGAATEAPLAPATAPERARPTATAPRTERLASPTVERNRSWIWIVALPLVATLALVVWLAPSAPVETLPPAPAPEPLQIKLEEARPRTSPAPPDPVVARPKARPAVPTPVAPAPAPTPEVIARPTFQAELAALDGALAARGLRPGDVPDIYDAREGLEAAIEHGEADAAVIKRLQARVEAFPIDRAFIEKKLARIQSQLERANLREPRLIEVARHSQLALSHSVSGRYAQANIELNVIAAMMGP